MRRVLVTGSREMGDLERVYNALRAQAKIAGGAENLTVVHGAATRGADAHAAAFCRWCPAVTEEAHPANWEAYGKVAGFIRNTRMVNLGADVVLAFPRGEARGTYDCVTRAKAAKIPVIFG